MSNITIGDYIKHIEKGTTHYVESIEYVNDKIILFTEDSKCFPIDKVEKTCKSIVANFFYKLLKGEKITVEEEQEAISRMKELNIARFRK